MNFDEEIKEGLVLVDFFATWCGPCKMLSPVLEEVEKEIDDLKVIRVDVDKNEDLAKRYAVMSIPKLIIFKDGKEVSSKVGFDNKDGIISFIESCR